MLNAIRLAKHVTVFIQPISARVAMVTISWITTLTNVLMNVQQVSQWPIRVQLQTNGRLKLAIYAMSRA